ncbi:DUF1292 domain-containing protein [Mediannikoviicoccus vaginalis]|uniref:DUF1292 domain-containing protein n=1 Tax=Mediannikoviicoccus vaginalis TaxID=2899727 RepID=UPI001F245158|nr:DUF1292 domain-containing protein [Mediannikoviicoccus vaginalis]
MSEDKKFEHSCGCNHDHHDECGCGHDHHDHDCGCGCEEEVTIVELNLEDGTDLECEVIGDFYLESQKQHYIALVTCEDREVLLYRLTPDAVSGTIGGDATLDRIETEEEYNEVVKEFSRIFFDGELEDMDEE